MSAINLEDSLRRAEVRTDRRRQRRADRGRARLAASVEAEITRIMGSYERPSMTAAHGRLREFCLQRGLPVPSRSTLYNAISRVPTPRVETSTLPSAVRRCLYNMDLSATTIAGDDVAFYAFNHGDPRALSFAAALPWLCLHRANERQGWRPKSRALLRAVMGFRGIPS